MGVRSTVHDGGILEVVVDCPPVNAFSIGVLADIAARLQAVAGEADVRAVVLRGEGQGFCGGGDIKEVERLPGFEGILGQALGSQDASLAVAECAAPVIAAIHGYCVGVGVLLAGTADIVVAGTGTRFVLAEVDNGATAGGVQALGLLPTKRLAAALFTAEPVDVSELHAYGSIYRLVSPETVVSTAFEVARVIATKSPEVVRRLKLAFNASAGVSDLRARYRQELSYTYELNLMGEAQQRREDVITRTRGG